MLPTARGNLSPSSETASEPSRAPQKASHGRERSRPAVSRRGVCAVWGSRAALAGWWLSPVILRQVLMAKARLWTAVGKRRRAVRAADAKIRPDLKRRPTARRGRAEFRSASGAPISRLGFPRERGRGKTTRERWAPPESLSLSAKETACGLAHTYEPPHARTTGSGEEETAFWVKWDVGEARLKHGGLATCVRLRPPSAAGIGQVLR
eukprot:scaffold2061_cov246-Pinguiococcus_pyrenoidosus.AAC.14